MKNQRKTHSKSLWNQCSQEDHANLAKIVPWSIPRLQNGSPDGSQENPDGSQNPWKITLLGIWDPPAAANRSQGCSGGGKPSKMDPKIIKNWSQNDVQELENGSKNHQKLIQKRCPGASEWTDSYLVVLVGTATQPNRYSSKRAGEKGSLFRIFLKRGSLPFF